MGGEGREEGGWVEGGFDVEEEGSMEEEAVAKNAPTESNSAIVNDLRVISSRTRPVMNRDGGRESNRQ